MPAHIRARTPATRRSVLALLAAACAPATGLAQAAWPTRPITLVVPFPPGGQTDVIGRLLSAELARPLGQPVVVDNRAGVNGSMGSEAVARATPDGHTLVVSGAGSHAINQLVNPNVRYDARTDFTHIAMIARTGNVLVCGPSFKGTTVQDVITQSRAKQRSLNFALTGIGSSGHLSMELMKQAAGIDFNAVPYRGDAPAMADVMGGQADLLFVNIAAAAQHVLSGKLRALAVTSEARNPLLPNVPTMGEQGLPAVVADSWAGLCGPKGMPATVVQRLNQLCQDALASAEVRGRLQGLGMSAMPGSSRDAEQFVAAEVAKWSRVVAIADVRI